MFNIVILERFDMINLIKKRSKLCKLYIIYKFILKMIPEIYSVLKIFIQLCNKRRCFYNLILKKYFRKFIKKNISDS